jgi:hypothetical protein
MIANHRRPWQCALLMSALLVVFSLVLMMSTPVPDGVYAQPAQQIAVKCICD